MDITIQLDEDPLQLTLIWHDRNGINYETKIKVTRLPHHNVDHASIEINGMEVAICKRGGLFVKQNEGE